MAKRKHSTALFEVITKSSHYARPQAACPRRAGLLATARKWFARGEPTRLASRMEPAAEALPAEPAAEATAFAPAASEAPEPTDYSDLQAGPPAQNLAVAVDSERRQIALRMSYTVAIVGGFTIVVIVALSIIVGQRFNHSGVPLLAQTTTDELRKGPAHREVLDPPRRVSGGGGGGSIAQTPELTQGQSNRPAGNGPGTNDSRAAGPAANAPSVAADGKRYISLNYVIVQSYPEAEHKMAEEAAAFLNKEGVSCTIETGVKGYLPITVVGLQGFDKQSSPAFKTYVQRIQQLSTKYAANNRSYKAFAPVAKKWDKQE